MGPNRIMISLTGFFIQYTGPRKTWKQQRKDHKICFLQGIFKYQEIYSLHGIFKDKEILPSLVKYHKIFVHVTGMSTNGAKRSLSTVCTPTNSHFNNKEIEGEIRSVVDGPSS